MLRSRLSLVQRKPSSSDVDDGLKADEPAVLA
jgi:hypothetical protein